MIQWIKDLFLRHVYTGDFALVHWDVYDSKTMKCIAVYHVPSFINGCIVKVGKISFGVAQSYYEDKRFSIYVPVRFLKKVK